MATTSTTASTYTPINDEEYINKMYDSNLTSQKATLESNYNTNLSNLDAEKEKAQKTTDTNLNRTYVENAKANKNYNEVQNAYGLSSGAMGQARLASDNQLQADLTALRNTQATADAEVERQRSILAQEYSSAIAKAQADNDLERAQALYEAAQADEDRLLTLQKEAGGLAANAGDFSIYKNLYGLTDDQVTNLGNSYQKDSQKEAASLMAGAGDFSLYKNLYGLTDAQVAALVAQYNRENGIDTSSGGGGGGSSGYSYYSGSGSGSGSGDRTSVSDSTSGVSTSGDSTSYTQSDIEAAMRQMISTGVSYDDAANAVESVGVDSSLVNAANNNLQRAGVKYKNRR